MENIKLSIESDGVNMTLEVQGKAVDSMTTLCACYKNNNDVYELIKESIDLYEFADKVVEEQTGKNLVNLNNDEISDVTEKVERLQSFKKTFKDF